MVITRATVAAVALMGAAAGLAGPAWADGRLDGEYRFINGATMNTWAITTQCNPEDFCGGTVSSSTGLIAQISKQTDGPWLIERHDVFNGRLCGDGSTGPADLTYSFDPASLTGTLRYTWKPGTCNDPNPGQSEEPISLQLL
ncbi:hypothetical protein [Mycolicibacterium holsaticum]|uniref:hypothetical protein n=1 Tax=Mycolicibacterium holsaticum TaxID=152142 RepID=UPI001C7DE51B|nr:hypothetical protein [Mycolicibacterium holsaticum]QZA12998.1 hypothetical protein K3U96_02010 [Mycolicibacterium holsaticum DSM 44478 = JCM 12374]UNC09526.1 hypothetical protein H5U41_24810 [Mycolicibacterium holsaticum DSM 44478 = JCM 12374]